MVSFLRPWLFLFIIILGEMLFTEIKITIKSTAEQCKIPRRIWEYILVCFLRRKQLNHKILRVLNVNSFREVFYHTFPQLLLRIISYTLYVLKYLLGYEFHLRFSVRKGFMWNLLYVNVKYQCVIFLSFTNI